MNVLDVVSSSTSGSSHKLSEFDSSLAINFDEYDDQLPSEPSSSVRSILHPPSSPSSHAQEYSTPSEIGLDQLRAMIPDRVLRTFDLQPSSTSSTTSSSSFKRSLPKIETGTSAETSSSNSTGASLAPSVVLNKKDKKEDGSILQALVVSIGKAMNGESIVSAPSFHRGLPWLGSIFVTPGSLKGSLVAKHRTYLIQAQVLAGGHVLPWTIGREWRYSELRKLLVDDLQQVVNKNGLESYFEPLYDSFPPKTWQNRNTDETAEFRGKAIETYIGNVIQVANKIMEDQDAKKRSSKKKKNRNSVNNADLGVSASASSVATSQLLQSMGYVSDGSKHSEAADGASSRKNSLDGATSEGLGDVVSLIVTKLLNINRLLRRDVEQVSLDLGRIITSTPTDHCHVTKEFKITPQQAL